MKKSTIIIALAAALLFAFAACEGPAGPQGPKGEPGNNGSQNPNNPQGLTTLSAAYAYLMAAEGGDSVANPVTIAVSMDLGVMGYATEWHLLLAVIGRAGKFISLDLSDCTMIGTVFSAYTTSPYGKDKIVSLILPAAAKLVAGFFSNPSDGSYTNMTFCSGANITSIGMMTFFDCLALQSVSFPLATSIGNSSFYGCTALQSVSFPLVTSIGDSAFAGCTALQSVSFPAAENIGWRSFEDCTALQSVSFPVVQSIGTFMDYGYGTEFISEAFYGCTALESVSFPVAQSIGNSAFSGCTALQSVSFPVAQSIGISVFTDCTALQSVSFPLVKSIGAFVDYGYGTIFVSSAFSGCTALENVSFPLVQSIGEFSFEGCTALQSITIPATADIEAGAFARCTSLVSFIVTGSGPLDVIEGGKALVRNNTELVAYPAASGTITMSTITSFDYKAFSFCTTLQSVSFPALQSIGDYFFSGCTALESVSFPAAQSIGRDAFYHCIALHSVNIPSVTNIDSHAFGDTATAMTVTMGNPAPTVGSYIFSDPHEVAKSVTVRVPAAAVASYNTAWQNAFLGLGSDGTGWVNSNITLTIETY